MNRRNLFKLGLFSATTMAVAGCGLPPHTRLISQIDMPELRLPGKSRYFATTCGECAGGCGVSVRVVDGRAKKLEGIPEHPISHGKVCALGMSSVQALYNPDRLYQPLHGSTPASWDDALKELAGQIEGGNGKTLWITRRLRGSTGSLILSMAQKVGAKVWVLELDGGQAERAAIKALTGTSSLPYHDLQMSDLVLNFGGNFLHSGANPVHYNWGYGEMRGGDLRGVMISFSSHMNATVANSDRWVPVKPGGEAWVALALGNMLAAGGAKGWLPWASSVSMDEIVQHTGSEVTPELLNKLLARVKRAYHPIAVGGGHVGGYSNGTWQLEVIFALNRLLNDGKLLTWEPEALVGLPSGPVDPAAVLISSQEAMTALQAGTYATVWAMDTNPVYLFTGSKFNISESLKKSPNLVVFTPFQNETSAQAQWTLPIATWMEAFGDGRVEGPLKPGAAPGVVYNVQQPAVELRPGSLALTDVLLDVVARSKQAGNFPWATTRDLIRQHTGDEWSQVQARGGVYEAYPLDWEPYTTQAGPLWPPRAVTNVGTSPATAGSTSNHVQVSASSGPQEAKFNGDEKDFVLIPYLGSLRGDGYGANRPWLQEICDPMGMVAWTDWIEISTELAKAKEIERGDILRLTSPAGQVEGPAYPTPGIHPEAVAIPLGQGHFGYGRYAGRGMQVLQVLVPEWQAGTGELALCSTRVRLEKTDRSVALISMDRRLGGQPREVFPSDHLRPEVEMVVPRDAH